MRDNQRYNYHDRIIDEAANWFARAQDDELSCDDRAAFAAWLSASPEHVREYLALANLHDDISALPPVREAEELIQLTRHSRAENVIDLRAGFAPKTAQSSADLTEKVPHPAGTRIRAKSLVALTASVAILAFTCLGWLYPNPNTATYATSVGEQKSFALPDGSVVTLNAVSKLRIRYTEGYRDVELMSGEALFSVAKNRDKPFRVLTRDSIIQAIGTQFDVYHRHTDTTVTVVEGTIEIMPTPSQPEKPLQQSLPVDSAGATKAVASTHGIRLTKGERAHITEPNVPVAVSTADAAVATAWRERRLTFESRPLGEVVAEFNLYNRTPIEIQGAALKDIEVSGSFNANDPQSFALFLQEAKLAKPRVESDKILLMPRDPR